MTEQKATVYTAAQLQDAARAIAARRKAGMVRVSWSIKVTSENGTILEARWRNKKTGAEGSGTELL